MSSIAFFRSAKRRHRALLLAFLVACVAVGVGFWTRASVDTTFVATVRRGTLTAQLTAAGVLRPNQALTYRSPLAGREMEIADLVPEGTRVNDGDLLFRLDTTDLQREVGHAQQELRQLQTDVQVAEGERQEAEATVTGVSEGEGALTVEEARTRMQLAQKKATRLRVEYDQLKPLMDKGFITRDELAKTADGLEQAEEELALANKKADVVARVTHPRDKQRAVLQLAQKESQLDNARARLEEAKARVQLLIDQVDSCRVYARRPGLVVYEEFLNGSPRRKVRVGDRVGNTQGVVTIPEVNRMRLEASVAEAEVHRVRPGQLAEVRVEAFPEVRLTGQVVRVGTLATSSIDHPLEDKRFELIVELDATTAELRPEMTARADIVVATRQDVLLVPVNGVFARQGTFVVHVAAPRGVETRAVQLGESNERLIEVVSGLEEHERVLLVDSNTTSTSAPADASPRRSEREGGNALQPR